MAVIQVVLQRSQHLDVPRFDVVRGRFDLALTRVQPVIYGLYSSRSPARMMLNYRCASSSY